MTETVKSKTVISKSCQYNLWLSFDTKQYEISEIFNIEKTAKFCQQNTSHQNENQPKYLGH